MNPFPGSVLRIAALVVLPLAIVSGVAPAQTCRGQMGYIGGAVKFGADAEFGNGARAFTGTFGLGKPGTVFGAAGAGVLTGNGETGLLILGLLGKELRHPVAGRLELCPVAGIGLQFGPSDYYERNFAVGVMVGYPMTRSSGAVRIIVTGGVQGAYQRYGFHGTDVTTSRRADRSAGGDQLHEWYGLLDAGIGFVFRNRFSVVPQLRIPVGYDMRDASFLIRASINYGNTK